MEKIDCPHIDPDASGTSGDQDFQLHHLGRYAEIGLALSGEEDIPKLLEMIVYEAREITNADAGTLYMVNEDRTHLEFVILQNESMRTFLGGVDNKKPSMPPVPLFVDGQENHAHVSAHVALTGNIVNIQDVYTSSKFDFSGTRSYDAASGYRSKSMLVIPMRNHEQDIIGVLQLLNARPFAPANDDKDAIIEFSDKYVALVAALASQAAVTLTKTKLLYDFKELLDSFVRSIAAAIETKSRYTGGHIARVSRLALMLAQKINETENGPFADTHFSSKELEELRLAAWLHDVGKIATPEYVVDKSTKLEGIFDRIHYIEARYAFIRQTLENQKLQLRLTALEKGLSPDTAAEQECIRQMAELDDDLEFIKACNKPGEFLTDDKIMRLQEIEGKTWEHDGEHHPFLEKDELANLSIRKGTLNPQERQIIEAHAELTYKMLSELPFPKHLRRVPDFASQHHEKLDGSGYPFGLGSEDLSLQARIMAVADIFEALTAPDRPYKKPMPLSMAIRILGQMKDEGHVDPRVHDLLLDSGLISTYAREELAPAQVDIPLEPTVPSLQEDKFTQYIEQLFAAAPVKDTAREKNSLKQSLLVVDSSHVNRMLLSYYLQETPFALEFAGEGAEGLELLVQQGHEWVLLALEMRPLDGYELARRIREWEDRHNLQRRKILALAAPFLPLNQNRLCDVGFSGVVRRPFGKKVLLEFLKKHAD